MTADAPGGLTEDEREALAFAMTGPDLFAVVARIKAAARAEALREAANALDAMQTPDNEALDAIRRDPALWLHDRAATLFADAPAPREAERACACPPCPGRGNDGHGLTHCAECCFGTGVEADIDCPIHGEAERDAGVRDAVLALADWLRAQADALAGPDGA